MSTDEPKVVQYWIKDTVGGIAKQTTHGGFAWHKGVGWVFWPEFADITYGKNMDWSPIVDEADAFKRIQQIEDGKAREPFDYVKTVYNTR